tara:strand:- start:492 stop:866 length:375 start_codon:yes stop_codon:yes gene_type:complete
MCHLCIKEKESDIASKVNKITIEEWCRFESMAEHKDSKLWSFFDKVLEDKEKIKDIHLCAFRYFHEYLFDDYQEHIGYLFENDIMLNNKDVIIASSIILGVIPTINGCMNNECGQCSSLESVMF